MAKSKNDRNVNFSDQLSNVTVANHAQSDRFTSNDGAVNERRSQGTHNSINSKINQIDHYQNQNLRNAVIVDMATGQLTSVIVNEKK